MSDSANLSGVAAVPWQGRAVEIESPRTFRVEGLFSVWCKREALAEILRSEKDVPAHVHLLRLRHNADAAAFTFAWGGEGCEAARYSEAGVREMFYLQWLARDKDAKREAVDEMARDPATYELMVRHAVGDLDPNRPRPAQGAQPSP